MSNSVKDLIGKVMKLWEIKYTKDGKLASINREADEPPSREYAAQQLRDALFQPFIIPDTPRSITKDITVWQLERFGVHIVDILEVQSS